MTDDPTRLAGSPQEPQDPHSSPYQPPTYETPTHETPSYETPPYAPPTHQAPTHQAPTHQAPTYQSLAMPRPETEVPTRRVPGWTWPAMAALALVVGLIGGALGATLHEEFGGPSLGLEKSGVRTAPPLEEGNTSVSAVAGELLPSTVQILAKSGEASGTGSGFILDSSGRVVTNNHVVTAAADSGEIQVVDFQGRIHEATIVGRSAVYDLAVLQVDGVRKLEPASLGASEDLLVGDQVIAFGAPLGLSQTVTSGIVSALNRPVTTGSNRDESSFINAVQTDAAINPGNSGGPLVNISGQVVGVNSAIATTGGLLQEAGNIGVGFAIPIEQVKVTADQILRTGEARYPVIGARVSTAPQDEYSGALIDDVTKGSPAQAAGVRKGDRVIRLDDNRVTDGVTLIVQIRTYQPGDVIELTVVRDGEEKRLSVKLGSEVG